MSDRPGKSVNLPFSKSQIIAAGNASANARDLVLDYFTGRISEKELLAELKRLRRVWRKNRPGWNERQT